MKISVALALIMMSVVVWSQPDQQSLQSDAYKAAAKAFGAQYARDIFRKMNSTERVSFAEATRQSLRADLLRQQVFSKRSQSGLDGYVVASREGQDSLGNYCREIQSQVSIQNEVLQGTGTVCMNSTGRWQSAQQRQISWLPPLESAPEKNVRQGSWLPPLN